jgi:hypothetical protein
VAHRAPVKGKGNRGGNRRRDRLSPETEATDGKNPGTAQFADVKKPFRPLSYGHLRWLNRVPPCWRVLYAGLRASLILSAGAQFMISESDAQELQVAINAAISGDYTLLARAQEIASVLSEAIPAWRWEYG